MPTRDTTWPAGTPCWVDYSAADLPAAQAFYTDLLGWTYTEGDPEHGGYLTCLAEGQEAAGMMPRMDASTPPSWTTYFATDDADKTAEAISAGGGPSWPRRWTWGRWGGWLWPPTRRGTCSASGKPPSTPGSPSTTSPGR